MAFSIEHEPAVNSDRELTVDRLAIAKLLHEGHLEREAIALLEAAYPEYQRTGHGWDERLLEFAARLGLELNV